MTQSQSADAAQGVNLGLIITPMLDMAFQLLAFFVMTYHPSVLEAHFSGELLPPEPAGKVIEAGDDIPDPKEVLVLVMEGVRQGQGEPTRLLLRQPENPQADLIADADSSFDAGLQKLEQALGKRRNRSARDVINIQADGGLKHQYVIRAYDACKAAGFRQIGFVAPAVQGERRP